MSVNTWEETLAKAAAWVQRLEAADLNEQEWLEFEAWLAEDESHRNAFSDAQSAWTSTYVSPDNLADVLALAPEVKNRNPLFGRLAKKFMARLRPLRTSQVAFPTAIASGLIAAVLLFSVTVWKSPGEGPFLLAETGYGETKTLDLADGTSIELNTDTELGYNFSDNQRRIQFFNGEAYFEVEKDSTRRFEIVAGDHLVTVIGTAFNLKYLNRRLDLSVVEGVVSISSTSSSSAIRVAQGEALSIGYNGEIVRREVNPTIALAWRSGAIAFENQTLEAILTDIDRYYPERLSSADLRGSELYTGLIYVDDLENVLDQLSLISSTEITFDENEGLTVD
jgi:transmembrane sensor